MSEENNLVIEIPANNDLTREEANDMIAIPTLGALIRQNPERKLSTGRNRKKDDVRLLVAVLFLAAVMVIWILCMDSARIVGYIGLGACGFILLMKLIVAISNAKAYKRMKANPHSQVLTLDENGVDIVYEDGQNYKLPWTAILCVRQVGSQLAFFPNEQANIIIFVGVEHTRSIFEYLRVNKPDVKIISEKYPPVHRRDVYLCAQSGDGARRDVYRWSRRRMKHSIIGTHLPPLREGSLKRRITL